LEVIVVHDLIAAAERVADERAFIRLLQVMAWIGRISGKRS
jgi:hypothetical protein